MSKYLTDYTVLLTECVQYVPLFYSTSSEVFLAVQLSATESHLTIHQLTNKTGILGTRKIPLHLE
jgi:hypothetical protein